MEHLDPKRKVTSKLSNSQIDRLGDRLRKGSPSEAELTLLDEYRRSFGEAYDIVVRTIRDRLQLEPTGRPAKSTSSLIEKLQRESIRLSQVQDISGCRVVVTNVTEQVRVVASLESTFPRTSVVDRRKNPSYGYRAIHVIALISGKLIEIQVRSYLQHIWAELSEKHADVIDLNIKYGGGPETVQKDLAIISTTIAQYEEFEYNLPQLEAKDKNQQFQQDIQSFRKQMLKMKESIVGLCNNLSSSLK